MRRRPNPDRRVSNVTLRIAVTQRVFDNPTYQDRRDMLSQDWIAFVEQRLKAIALPMPNRLRDVDAWCAALQVDALLLSNGEDWGVASDRDALEAAAFAWFRGRNLPVLGVCRGLQVVNHLCGGRIETDLQASCGHPAPRIEHEVTIGIDAFAGLPGAAALRVNSFHLQGVTVDGLAPELRAFAAAANGVVEGLYHPAAPILAIQWHPERPGPSATFDEALIGRFLAKGAFWSIAS